MKIRFNEEIMDTIKKDNEISDKTKEFIIESLELEEKHYDKATSNKFNKEYKKILEKYIID
jgi:hypothetical protein